MSAVTLSDSKRVGTHANLAAIDAMRGVAALIVAAFHTREITWIGIRDFWQTHGLSFSPEVILGYLTFPLAWGSIGVPVFFVISGYCIHRSQAAARVRQGNFGLSIGNFYLRRFFRIYPVLFGALLLTLTCDLVSRHYFPNSYKLGDDSSASLLINLFSLQGVAGAPYGSNLPLWTLSIEVQFYALYPFLLLLMLRFGNGMTFVILGLMNVVSYFTLERHGYRFFTSYYVSWYLGALVCEFECRGWFSDFLESSRMRAALHGISFLLLGTGCILYFLSVYAAFQIWALTFSIFLLLALKRPKPIRGYMTGLFQRFGAFSFSLYIIHMPVVVLIHSILFNSIHQVSIAPFFLTLLAVIGCAYIFFLVFERPALALSQRFGRHRLAVNRAAP